MTKRFCLFGNRGDAVSNAADPFAYLNTVIENVRNDPELKAAYQRFVEEDRKKEEEQKRIASKENNAQNNK